MSSTAPWLALACDWHESEMFIGATAGQKLAWVAMLCFSKSRGRAGVFTLRRHALCQEFSIEPSDVDQMLDRAVEHGAASVEGDVVTLTGWRTYQDPSQRRGSLVKDGGFTKKSATTLTTPTKHPSPSTKSKSKSARMPIPSVEQCVEYGKTIDLPASECGKFHDYHTSKGWLVGKVAMKDWKAAMRTWKRNHDDGMFSSPVVVAESKRKAMFDPAERARRDELFHKIEREEGRE